MKTVSKFALTAIALSFSVFASAGMITLDGPGATDVDTIPATTVSLSTAAGGTITDLDVYIDLDASCCSYDNTVILSHDDTGTSAVLWLDGLGSGTSFGDVLDVTFDDEAAMTFVDAATANGFDLNGGTYVAMNLLSIFDGEDMAGTWTLSIENTGCCAFEGDDLLAWGLNITTAEAVPEPSSLALIGLGLLGMGASSRKRS